MQDTGFAVPVELGFDAFLVGLSFDGELLIEPICLGIDEGVEGAAADEDFLGAFGFGKGADQLAGGGVEAGDGIGDAEGDEDLTIHGN